MELPKHHTDWLLWLLFAAVTVIISVRLYNRQRFRDFAILPFHARRRELEDDFKPEPGRGFVDLSLSLLSTFILTLTCFLLLHPYNNEFPLFNNWVLFLRLLFVLMLFFVVKNFVGMLVGWVFNKSEEIAISQNVNLAYRTWIAILLLPLCIMAIFFPPAYKYIYYVLLLVISIGYYFAFQFAAIRIWRMGVVSYYKVFYLCALEITPLIFLVGWLLSLSG